MHDLEANWIVAISESCAARRVITALIRLGSARSGRLLRALVRARAQVQSCAGVGGANLERPRSKRKRERERERKSQQVAWTERRLEGKLQQEKGAGSREEDLECWPAPRKRLWVRAEPSKRANERTNERSGHNPLLCKHLQADTYLRPFLSLSASWESLRGRGELVGRQDSFTRAPSLCLPANWLCFRARCLVCLFARSRPAHTVNHHNNSPIPSSLIFAARTGEERVCEPERKGFALENN